MQTVRGFRDILPEDIAPWQRVENEARKLFEDFGFREIRLPILEKTEVFARSIGEVTDIVEKEMYTFPDRKGGNLTLRPEATASVVRSYIQHKMYASDPVQKLYTIGPMFRRERPQKGRYRQFYQIDAEIFGIDSPYVDSGLIVMLTNLFRRLGLTGLKAHINSLGCRECRPDFQAELLRTLDAGRDKLCENCQRRIHKNPMRVLDCKAAGCREAMAEAPCTTDHLCGNCRDHFETVRRMLDVQSIEYVEDKSLVRGLDYYTRTAFEIQTDALGAQSAVAGGGRYDALVRELGGPDMPAIGFAIGFDRLVEVMTAAGETFSNPGPDLFITALGSRAREKAYLWSTELNLNGLKTETDFRDKSLKSLMKRADRLKASFVLIAGDSELENRKLILRNMATKEQIHVDADNPLPDIYKTINTQELGKGHI